MWPWASLSSAVPRPGSLARHRLGQGRQAPLAPVAPAPAPPSWSSHYPPHLPQLSRQEFPLSQVIVETTPMCLDSREARGTRGVLVCTPLLCARASVSNPVCLSRPRGQRGNLPSSPGTAGAAEGASPSQEHGPSCSLQVTAQWTASSLVPWGARAASAGQPDPAVLREPGCELGTGLCLARNLYSLGFGLPLGQYFQKRKSICLSAYNREKNRVAGGYSATFPGQMSYGLAPHTLPSQKALNLP